MTNRNYKFSLVISLAAELLPIISRSRTPTKVTNVFVDRKLSRVEDEGNFYQQKHEVKPRKKLSEVNSAAWEIRSEICNPDARYLTYSSTIVKKEPSHSSGRQSLVIVLYVVKGNGLQTNRFNTSTASNFTICVHFFAIIWTLQPRAKQ
ncbi:hypothetical protein NQ317_011563 [Molorchus minor]|uniref:Uncharacterized protein n=1 Tax=Molorchus minor TaxID=1323400 RepID=A0ABQ9JSY0_9CUCU|nr:hypothetical protein NQ317_011563 [Molorchus minor]